MKRAWLHRTRVYKDGPFWRWDCSCCGLALADRFFGYLKQPEAFAQAWKHTSVGGYIAE